MMPDHRLLAHFIWNFTFFCSLQAFLIVGPISLVAQDNLQSRMKVVKNGKPIATVVVTADGTDSGGQTAAELLVDWVRKMTQTELPIVNTPPRDGPVILVGRAAVQAGLKLSGSTLWKIWNGAAPPRSIRVHPS